MPAEKIDRNLADFITPMDPGSYTRLWLDSLSAPPNRSEYEPLIAETTLCNGRYRVDKPIGSGGQGTVYRATVLRKDKDDEPDTVVLKEFVLPVQGGKEASVKSLAHVEQEAALLKSLDHPQIVKFVDMFVEDHRAYLVMQFAQGSSLRDVVVESGPLGEVRAKTIGLQMCEILAYLHGQTPPVIHRDFTPENLMLGPDGVITLIDFNVAQQLDCTTTRTIAGKHAYIPPEQFRGTATAQSDIYAAGASLFYLLIGEEPEPISVSHPLNRSASVSLAMDDIVAKATALDALERYADSAALKADLEQLQI
jgi:serine/threonine-protein kinase